MSDYNFRLANETDTNVIFSLLVQLAAYENRSSDFKLSQIDLDKAFKNKHIQCLICDYKQKPVGTALWCDRFSPYAGGINMLLIDLYIEIDYRAKGLGRRFIAELQKIATDNHYVRMEWFVDTENEDAKRFYTKLGGQRIEHSEHWKLNLY